MGRHQEKHNRKELDAKPEPHSFDSAPNCRFGISRVFTVHFGRMVVVVDAALSELKFCCRFPDKSLASLRKPGV